MEKNCNLSHIVLQMTIYLSTFSPFPPPPSDFIFILFTLFTY